MIWLWLRINNQVLNKPRWLFCNVLSSLHCLLINLVWRWMMFILKNFKAALEKHRPPETYNTVLRTLMFVYEIIFLWAFFQYLCYYEEKANYFKVLDQIRFQDKLANPDKCPCHRNGDWAPEPIFLLGNRENYYLYKCFCTSRGSPVGSKHPSSGSSTKWQNPLICPLANSTVQWL